MANWLQFLTHGPTMRCPIAEIPRDDNGQPSVFLNAEHRSVRSTTEVIGFLRGIMADGIVTEREVISLAKWLCANTENDQWPVGVIVERVGRVMQDGVLEPHELTDLKELFEQVIGGPPDHSGNKPTKLPLTEPHPPIQFSERVFVFTGRFVLGSRKYCEGLVAERGGLCHPRVTRKTSYVVIGGFSSRDWLETTFGRKILAAVEYADCGLPIAIVDEKHFASHLKHG